MEALGKIKALFTVLKKLSACLISYMNTLFKQQQQQKSIELQSLFTLKQCDCFVYSTYDLVMVYSRLSQWPLQICFITL